MSPTAIIGGGWAGIACAVELTQRGESVELFEAAPQLGGRARSFNWHGIEIDNGPHLLLGAYRQTLKLVATLGTPPHLQRRPLQLNGPDLGLRLPDLPAPWHLAAGLLTCRGLSVSEKWQAARLIQRLARQQWRIKPAQTLQDFLHVQRQSETSIARLWQPLALAALNTPINQADAQTFVAVLRDSLGADADASHALFVQGPLTRLISEPAKAWLMARGQSVHQGQRIHSLRHTAAHWEFLDASENCLGRAKHLVLATSALAAVRLLKPLLAHHPAMQHPLAALTQLRWLPITNQWLWFNAPLHLPYPLQLLGEGDAPWLFERADLAPGLACVVYSGPGAHIDALDLPARSLELVQKQCGPLPALRAHKRVCERRATHASSVERPQFTAHSLVNAGVPNLWLAGDYVHPEYPATLEAAVASGVQCARARLGEPA